MKKIVISFLLVNIFFCCHGQTKSTIRHDTQVAITPPMGWNSYDSYGAAVTEKEVRANAVFMAKNLKQYGWNYIVIDYCWYYPHPPGSTQENPPQFRLKQDNAPVPWMPMDQYGRLLPDPRKFPSSVNGKGFKPLADYVHSLGLKFGIHIMRGIPRQALWARSKIKGTQNIDAIAIADTASICRWLNLMYGVDMKKNGAQAYYNSLFELYAQWGVDFIKVDNINAGEEEAPYRVEESEGYVKAIANCKRPMVLSLSSQLDYTHREQLSKSANMWRIADDFWDEWSYIKNHFALCAKWAKYSKPGHWPDGDMIPFGNLRLRGPSTGVAAPGKSRFTPDEHYTLMTLLSIFRSPLMIGGNLPDADDFLKKILTNKEVIEVNQQCENSKEVYNESDIIVWMADQPGTKNKYIAFFNTGEENKIINIPLSVMNLIHNYKMYDLWEKKNAGNTNEIISIPLSKHGTKFFKLHN